MNKKSQALIIVVVNILLISSLSGSETLKEKLSIVLDGEPIARCLIEAKDPYSCIGNITRDCEGHPLVLNEYDAAKCSEIELEEWDSHLNSVYKRLMVQLIKEDKLDGRIPYSGRSARSQDLRTMQRAWIKFRNKKCQFKHTISGVNLGSAIEEIKCRFRETASQYIYLNKHVELNIF